MNQMILTFYFLTSAIENPQNQILKIFYFSFRRIPPVKRTLISNHCDFGCLTKLGKTKIDLGFGNLSNPKPNSSPWW